MINHVVDAHALLWFFEGNPKLGDVGRTVFGSSSSQFIVPTIAMAELIWVIKRGRTRIADWRTTIDAMKHDNRFRFAPMTVEIVIRSMDFVPRLEMHDAQIVATTLMLRDQGIDAVLVTSDSQIIESKIVPTVW